MVEQFLFALADDGRYYFIKSPGVELILSDSNIQDLRMRKRDNGPQWLPTEQVVAIQHIEPTSDKSGREGVWNHTILIPIREYIQHSWMNPISSLNRLFLSKSGSLPARLESISL